MYVTLLIVGSVIILAANVYKVWADKVEKDEKQVADAEKARLALVVDETRHQETIAVIAASEQRASVYRQAYEEVKKQALSPASSTTASSRELDFKFADERFEQALREVAPATVERIDRERKKIRSAVLTESAIEKSNSVARPILERALPIIRATILRSKSKALFPNLTVTEVNAVPELLYSKDFSDRFVPLLVVDFGVTPSVTWNVNLARAVVIISDPVDREPNVGFPQLLIEASMQGKCLVRGGIDIDATNQPPFLRFNLVGGDASNAKRIESAVGRLTKLVDEAAIVTGITEAIAETNWGFNAHQNRP